MILSKVQIHPTRLSFVLGLLILTLVEPVVATTARYTAQRKPRVTVMEFENTNAEARQARYGESVEAMLVTFLKRKSQFVVVERQKIEPVLKEWENNQLGVTNINPEESQTQEILEKIDGIILGSVTLLGSLDSSRLEIDVKLLLSTPVPFWTDSPVRVGHFVGVDVASFRFEG